MIVHDTSMINDSCGRNYPWYGSKNQGKKKINFLQFIDLKLTTSGYNSRSNLSTIWIYNKYAGFICTMDSMVN